MTGQEIRDLGYLKWRDSLAWMENMKGKKWDNLLKKEKENYNYLTNQPHVEKEARHMEKEILDAQQYTKLPGFKIGCGTIDISPSSNYGYTWKWSWSKSSKIAYDIDVQGNIVWYVTSDEDNISQNKVICESSDGKKIWSKNAVSSQIAIIGELCYFIKVVDYFRTVELCVCNSQTGLNEKVLYREKDKRRDLTMIKAANKTLYLISNDPINSILFRINGLKIEQLAKNSLIQMPLGESIYGDDCILTRKSKFSKWDKIGRPISDWILPDEAIEFVNLQSGTIVTIYEGSQSIWYCSPRKQPKLLFKLKVGIIEPNIWGIWENSLVESFIIKSPFRIPYIINMVNNKITLDERYIKIENPIEFKELEVHKYHTTSKDNTKVPFIILHEKGIKPKAQLIYVYGAYGSSTPIGWPFSNWYPLLKRKWALVFALVRGGGDSDANWAEAARRDNRHKSIEDFEAVIRAAQYKNKLGANKTVIYGRSAGGIPIGSTISRHPDGHLIGAAFTEVPYVDVLRTSSNPSLPLTIGEFDEFGNPLERIVNFKELLSVSPINTLPADGAPGIFVICRIGLLDKQVYPYESFKWIQKLRGYDLTNEEIINEPNGKYLTFEKKEGHKYNPDRFPRFRAIDLAILDAWSENKLKY